METGPGREDEVAVGASIERKSRVCILENGRKKPVTSLRERIESFSRPLSVQEHVQRLKRPRLEAEEGTDRVSRPLSDVQERPLSVQEHVQRLKRPRLEAEEGTDRVSRPLSDFQDSLLKKHRCEETDKKAPEEDEIEVDEISARDSEAGMFIESAPEGPYEPLVLEEGSDDLSARVEVPAEINSRLLDHQREGVKFLYNLYKQNQGGILGDDMGLGKTIQTIAFVSAILGRPEGQSHDRTGFKRNSTEMECDRDRRKVVLVLCPTSVIENWERELEVWGTFAVGVFHGTKREAVVNKVKANRLDIVLSSHDTFRIHGDLLLDIGWDCVFIDEAHRLKSDKSQLYRVCVQIRTQRRYGLTGTILQNKFMELFNVFEWAAPGCLGRKEYFRSFYDEPIKQGQRLSAPDLVVELAEKRRLHLLGVLRKRMLRRTKDETIGHLLKGKEDIVVFCAMSPLQRRVYTRLLESPDFQSLVKKDDPCSCGSSQVSWTCCGRTAPDGVIWQYLHRNSTDGCDACPTCLLLPCLTKLQQASNHLELLKPNPDDNPEKREQDEAFAAQVFGEDAAALGGTKQTQDFLGLSDAQHCGKMLALKTLLATWTSKGDKILLFSYSVRMLGILEKFLIRKGYSFCRLDGSIPMNARQAIVDDFNNSPSKQVFLISTRAGGLGLNLVSANRVVVFDPNWNPAQDLQAQDRSFRYGQKRHVTVFRLVAAGSLEELVYNRQIYKQQLFNIAVSGAAERRYYEGVQGSKANQGELFGMSNIFRDLKQRIVTSDIVGDKLVMVGVNSEYTESKVRSKAKVTDTYDEDEHGLGTLAELVKADMQESQGEQRTTDVDDLLHDAGVVYAHRNEEVVNIKPGKVDIPEELLDQEKPKQQRRPAGRVRDKVERPKPAQDKTRATAKDQKGQQFAELAKFKGMNEKAFSKWLVSAGQAEREELLASFRKSKAK